MPAPLKPLGSCHAIPCSYTEHLAHVAVWLASGWILVPNLDLTVGICCLPNSGLPQRCFCRHNYGVTRNYFLSADRYLNNDAYLVVLARSSFHLYFARQVYQNFPKYNLFYTPSVFFSRSLSNNSLILTKD